MAFISPNGLHSTEKKHIFKRKTWKMDLYGTEKIEKNRCAMLTGDTSGRHTELQGQVEGRDKVLLGMSQSDKEAGVCSGEVR